MDRTNRANSKLSPEKILQIIWHWITETSGTDTAELLDLEGNTVDDWFSYCREVCQTLNDEHWRNIKLGDGDGELRPGPNNRPNVVVQIDESLLRGRRKYNRGRLLQGIKKKFIINNK